MHDRLGDAVLLILSERAPHAADEREAVRSPNLTVNCRVLRLIVRVQTGSVVTSL